MAFVYWIRLPEHNDMFSEGYIGVTKNTVEGRYQEHKKRAKYSKRVGRLLSAIKKYGDELLVSPIVEADERYCYEVESKLRPQSNIGWNHNPGGQMANREYMNDAEAREAWIEKLRNHNLNNRKPISEEQKLVHYRVSKANWEDETFCKRMREIAVSSRRVDTKLRSGFWRLSVNSPLIGVADRVYNEYAEDPTKYAKEILINLNIEVTAHHIWSCLYLMRKFAGGWNPNEDLLWQHDFNDLPIEHVPDYFKFPEGWLLAENNKSAWVVADIIFTFVHMGLSATQIGKLYNQTRSPFKVMVKRIKDGWIPNEDPRWVKWRDEQLSLAENT